jgi:hypothetical protein
VVTRAEGADEKGSCTHFTILGIATLEGESWEVRLTNSQDYELRQAPLKLDLGHSTVVARRKAGAHA